jgi:hypothetical protein
MTERSKMQVRLMIEESKVRLRLLLMGESRMKVMHVAYQANPMV